MLDYNAFLFDFDGTLVNTFESLRYIFANSFKEVGYDLDPKEVYRLSRESLKDGYIRLIGNLDNYGQYVSSINRNIDSDYSYTSSFLFSETKEVLLTLHDKRKRLAIVTSNSSSHVERLLTMLGIDCSIFECIIGYEDYQKSKPNPEPLLVALNRMQIKNKVDAVYIGDGQNDMLAAKNANIQGILIDRDDSTIKENYYLKIKSLLEII